MGMGTGSFAGQMGRQTSTHSRIWANHATIEKRIYGQPSQNLGTYDRVTAAAEGDSEKELQAVCRTISGERC